MNCSVNRVIVSGAGFGGRLSSGRLRAPMRQTPLGPAISDQLRRPPARIRAAYSVELKQYRGEPNRWQKDFIEVIDYIGRPARRYGGAAAARVAVN
jgi:hypothetical protein